jgi:hypothetical protein
VTAQLATRGSVERSPHPQIEQPSMTLVLP